MLNWLDWFLEDWVVDNHNLILEPSSLVDILTLRYDPLLKSNLPKKNWQDFEPINKIPNIAFIEKSICNDLEQKLKNFEGQKFV